MNKDDIYKSLSKEALSARDRSYCPYSHFAVGAALMCGDGKIYTGCNIENAAFTPSNCAERTAFFKAVSDGERDFTAIAVAGGPEEKNVSGDSVLDECTPCGVCRQVMMEFCNPDSFVIILTRSENNYRTMLLKELLPIGFGPGNITV